MLWHGTYLNKARYDHPRIDRAVGHRDEHQPSGRMLFALYYDFNLFKVQVAEKTAGKLNTRMPISMGGLLSIHYLKGFLTNYQLTHILSIDSKCIEGGD